MDTTVENSSEILGALQAMRLQAQDQARRDRMAQPTRGSIRDSSARRRDSYSTKLIIGSTERCDLSSAIVETNVVRVST
ncbi:hypothetical protein L614_000800000040 [Ochrobactrum sp. J50]|nr:hypothetical protein L614_000800000040 [Ochrobactrum sp. J50]